jgi:hypothetical protein
LHRQIHYQLHNQERHKGNHVKRPQPTETPYDEYQNVVQVVNIAQVGMTDDKAAQYKEKVDEQIGISNGRYVVDIAIETQMI